MRRRSIEISSSLAANRLVTLTGAGGAGKTRLAIEVAGQVGSQFPDGVSYADLAPITDPELVPLTVARALGLPDQRGLSITETLLRSSAIVDCWWCSTTASICWRPAPTLVDDAARRLPAGDDSGDESRTLSVAGEVNWRVPSLSLTDEAVELFTDRARRARPDFARHRRELRNSHRDLPTSRRHAAGDRTGRRAGAGTVTQRDRRRPARPLPPANRRRADGGAAPADAARIGGLVTRAADRARTNPVPPLGGVHGWFRPRRRASGRGATEVERFQVLDQLSLLVDKSLVVAENAVGRTRYRLLETVRQYALEKLGESGEADEVRARHRDHYTAVAALLDAPATIGHEQRMSTAMAEMDNLRAAFVWSIENGEITEALELASWLQSVWLGQGRVREALAWLDAALADDAKGNLAVAFGPSKSPSR